MLDHQFPFQMCLDDMDHNFKEPITTCKAFEDTKKHHNKSHFTEQANVTLPQEEPGEEDNCTRDATSYVRMKPTTDGIHISSRSFSPFVCFSPFNDNEFESAEQLIGEPEKKASSNINFVQQNGGNDIIMSSWNDNTSALTTPVLESTEGFNYINIEA